MAFDGAVRKPVSANDLIGRDPARIKLHLQPYITLLELPWPLDDFLIGLRDNSRLRGEASNAMENSAVHTKSRGVRLPERRTVRLAVHRHRNIVYYKRLKKEQFELLTAIQNGASLQEALKEVKDVARVQGCFGDWSALGWFYLR